MYFYPVVPSDIADHLYGVHLLNCSAVAVGSVILIEIKFSTQEVSVVQIHAVQCKAFQFYNKKCERQFIPLNYNTVPFSAL